MTETTATVAQSSYDSLDFLIDDLRSFIDNLQFPRIHENDWLEQIHCRGGELAEKLSHVPGWLAGSMSSHLRAYLKALAEGACAQGLRDHYLNLEKSYEVLLLELKKRRIARAAVLARSRQLKPVNYARNIFHATMGITGVLLYYFVLTREQALMVLGTIFFLFGTLEVTRRFSRRWNDFLVDRFFGAISRPSERYRVTSATIYLVALLIVVLLFPKVPVLSAVLVLGISDPAASLAGKRWGRHKLFRDKSFAGTLAFFLSAILTTGALLLLVEPSLGPARIAAVSLAVAGAGAVTELLSSRIDDNLTIPIACALTATILL